MRELIEEGPAFLTRNGHGTVVVMSIDQLDYINGTVESALDVAGIGARLDTWTSWSSAATRGSEAAQNSLIE